MAARRLGRARTEGGAVQLVEQLQDGVFPCEGDLFEPGAASDRPLREGSYQLLVPVTPSKIIGIGSNYRAHALEMGRPLPPVPKVFLKPPTALLASEEPIELPPLTQRVDHEAEVALVIGRRLQRVSVEEALSGVLGLTVANDVTARDFQKADGVFARGKGFDSFCPLGPWVLRGADLQRPRAVRAWVNGSLRQDGRSDDLIFGFAELISFVSGIMTLLPGDLILTGTPAGVGPLQDGDRVEVEVEGIGRLGNPVRDRSDRT